MDNIEEAFNSDDYLYFYSDILTSERLQQELDLLIKQTELNQPLKILDLACGFGRHANALAALGHQVTGIDNSKDFLKIAQQEALRLNLQVEYLLGDMRTLEYQNAFDRVYALFTAIGYFDDAANERVFRNIFQALKKGGIFCFDSHNRDTFLINFNPSYVRGKDGNLMIDQNHFDTLTGYCKTKRTIVRDQVLRSFEYSVRFYNPSEISRILKEVGFSSLSFFEGWSGKPLDSFAKRMVVVARK